MTELFFDIKTTRKFAVLFRKIPNTVKNISAAIAYTQSDILVEACIENNIKLEWWGLFNSQISTNLDIIKKAIRSPNIKFYPFAKLFHPKVILFHGYGIYVGSHNMTDSAMYKNVEAGVFIDENDLTNEQKKEITDFFADLKKKSIPATKDDIDRIEKYISVTKNEQKNKEKIQTGIDDIFKKLFEHLFILKQGSFDHPHGKQKGDKESKQRLQFLQEWREVQNYLSIVQKHVQESKQPEWVSSAAETTIITDQLLHAYYYSYLLKGRREEKSVDVVNREYNKNKHNTEAAIDKAIKWWGTLDTAPQSEDVHINKWGPSNKEILSRLEERGLTEDEILIVLKQNHAARTHARQIKNRTFGLPDSFQTTEDNRVELYAKWLFKQKTQGVLGVNDVLRFLLFDKQKSVEERVYECIYNSEYRLEHFGKSIVGELIGWGRPEITYLRNNRVNKALRSLGYDVQLFSE